MGRDDSSPVHEPLQVRGRVNLAEVVTTLRADELKAIKLMREESSDNVDFYVCRREGRIVKVERTTIHVKEFSTERLKERGG